MKKLDDDLVRRIRIISDEFLPDDNRLAKQKADAAIKYAQKIDKPEWEPIRNNNRVEWKCIIQTDYELRAWPLGNGRWIGQIVCNDSRMNFIKILNSNMSAMIHAEAVFLWQNVSAGAAG